VQREAAAKEYRNMRYEQPYQRAMYSQQVLSDADEADCLTD
jgi:uncharacterized protein (DUF169 family)